MTLYADTVDDRRVRFVDGLAVYQAKDESGGKWWIATYRFSVYARTPEGAIATWHDHNRNVVRRTVGVSDGNDPGGDASRRKQY